MKWIGVLLLMMRMCRFVICLLLSSLVGSDLFVVGGVLCGMSRWNIEFCFGCDCILM